MPIHLQSHAIMSAREVGALRSPRLSGNEEEEEEEVSRNEAAKRWQRAGWRHGDAGTRGRGDAW
jgi:hypothetical protein